MGDSNWKDNCRSFFNIFQRYESLYLEYPYNPRRVIKNNPHLDTEEWKWRIQMTGNWNWRIQMTKRDLLHGQGRKKNRFPQMKQELET